MFRKILFWSHLVVGVCVGLIVALLSVTGLLLTYEHQLVGLADKQSWELSAPDSEALPVRTLADRAGAAGVLAKKVTVFRDEEMPVLVGGGRRDPSTYVNRYTGEVLGQPENDMRAFMHSVTALHRWLAMKGDARGTGKLIVGVANLGFLFLLLTGAYLWLPKVFRWPLFRKRLLLDRRYPNAKSRDFFWHHIFAAWFAVPLLAIILSGIAISFTWGRGILLAVTGSDDTTVAEAPATINAATVPADLDALLVTAAATDRRWTSISVVLPEAEDTRVDFELDTGSGRQPQKRTLLTLDAQSGTVVSRHPFSERSARRKVIPFNRFLHTGEWYGLIGQTLAGLASLASLVLVWTGFAQAWRRLIQPRLRKPVAA